jgi:hypothetical protein
MAKWVLIFLALLALPAPALPARQSPADAPSGKHALVHQRAMERELLSAQLSGQQREQYNVCRQSVARVRTELDLLAGGGSGFYLRQLRRQHQSLVRQMRAMEQANRRLVGSLNAQQKTAIRQQQSSMRLIEEHMHARLRGIGQELAKPNPSAEHVAGLARVMQQQINRWSDQNRAMGERLGLPGNPGAPK